MKCNGCGYITQGDEIHVCEKGDEIFIITNRKLAPPQPNQELKLGPCNLGIGKVEKTPLHIYAPKGLTSGSS